METPDGYLWLGTQEGLVRFDGVRFAVFDRSNTPAFANNHVTALLPTPAGLWWARSEAISSNGTAGPGSPSASRCGRRRARSWRCRAIARGVCGSRPAPASTSRPARAWSGTAPARACPSDQIRALLDGPGRHAVGGHLARAGPPARWEEHDHHRARRAAGRRRAGPGARARRRALGGHVQGARPVTTTAGLARVPRRATGWRTTPCARCTWIRRARCGSAPPAASRASATGAFASLTGARGAHQRLGGRALHRPRGQPLDRHRRRRPEPAEGSQGGHLRPPAGPVERARLLGRGRARRRAVGRHVRRRRRPPAGRALPPVLCAATRLGATRVRALLESRRGRALDRHRPRAPSLRRRPRRHLRGRSRPSARLRCASSTRTGRARCGSAPTAAGCCASRKDACVPDARPGLPSSQVRAILEDARGGFWVGTYGGLAVLRDGRIPDLHHRARASPTTTCGRCTSPRTARCGSAPTAAASRASATAASPPSPRATGSSATSSSASWRTRPATSG